ncbi:hypothetical protein L195_g045003, partial [Trifolium pratense]
MHKQIDIEREAERDYSEKIELLRRNPWNESEVAEKMSEVLASYCSYRGERNANGQVVNELLVIRFGSISSGIKRFQLSLDIR